jgi:hypothetical protein
MMNCYVNAVIISVVFNIILMGCSGTTEDEMDRALLCRSSSEDLANTEITPHLKANVGVGNNVLWCASFQVAWNELCDSLGGKVQYLQEESLAANYLNEKAVTKDILPEDSYLTVSGSNSGGVLKNLKQEFAKKFPEDECAFLSNIQSINPSNWIVYAYLAREMPFQTRFERMSGGVDFEGVVVEAFGIDKFHDERRDERKMAGQVVIYDYRHDDDFILELETKRTDDRMILAKLPEGDSLIDTIETVVSRLRESKSEPMKRGDLIRIPILDFDLITSFDDLCGPIRSASEAEKEVATYIDIARQRIRFRIDEGGAILESEALIAASSPPMSRHMVFDKPYLILIMKREVDLPYFALWVENTELMIPIKK